MKFYPDPNKPKGSRGYVFGYAVGAFEASQYLKEKYTLEEKI